MRKSKSKALHLRAIVIDEHTLALVVQDRVQILRASVLRGSSYSGTPHPATDCLPQRKRFRYATEADFQTYNVRCRPEWIATPLEIADYEEGD